MVIFEFWLSRKQNLRQGLYNNSLGSATPGKQEWGERGNEAGKEVKKKKKKITNVMNWDGHKQFWLPSLMWFLHGRPGRPQCFGTEEERTMELPLGTGYCRSCGLPRSSESCPWSPQAALRKWDSEDQWHYPCMSWAGKWMRASSTPQLSTRNLQLPAVPTTAVATEKFWGKSLGFQGIK